MSTYNDKKEEKKGFIPWLSRIFKSTPSSVIRAGSGAAKIGAGGGKGGLLASLFASKASMVGLVLGGATIAAGIGVLYNYIGPSSSKVYNPDLFANAYYEEAQKQASVERRAMTAPENAQASSLDVFKEVAKKEFQDESKPSGNKEENVNEESRTFQSADVADNSNNQPQPQSNLASGGGKLNANLGFETKQQGGSSSQGARLQTSGGLWGGIGKPFSPISRNVNTANPASTSKMKNPLTARLVGSPKYAVPNVNKKGAFGQAKYTRIVEMDASKASSLTSARNLAELPYSGGNTGSGDVATPIGGSGIGGAGLSQGDKLKANDPSLNTHEVTPPTPPSPKIDTPWKKLTDYALYAMLAAAGFIAIASLLANKAKALLASPVTAGAAVAWFNAARVFAYLAIAAAVAVIGIAGVLAFKYGQKMMGIMYGMVGGALIYQAYKALMGINEGLDKAKEGTAKYDEFLGKLSKEQSDFFKSLPTEKQIEVFNHSNPPDYIDTLMGKTPEPQYPLDLTNNNGPQAPLDPKISKAISDILEKGPRG